MAKTSNHSRRSPTGSARKSVGPAKHPVQKTRDTSKAIDALTAVAMDVEALISFFVNTQNVTANLSGKDRQKLIGSRVKNSGFIDKSFDLMRDNPAFLPMNLTTAQMAEQYNRFETLRQIVTLTAQLSRIAVDLFLLQSDVCYKIGLEVYRNLQALARSKVPGAIDLFQTLRWYFVNRGRKKGEEPTEKQIEKDAMKLIKGKADGAMLIENQRPVTVDGEHKVIDGVRLANDTAKIVEKIV